MEARETGLPGVTLLVLDAFPDERGYFLETYRQDRYRLAGITDDFVQDNHSFSTRGVLRGLHAQLDPAQAKLVRCVVGAVFDVAVDIRRGSPTYGRWFGAELTEDNRHQLFLPAGFAHGFQVVSDEAHVQYKCSAVYARDGEVGIAWNDPDIGIEWPDPQPILSEKDAAAPRLAALADRLPLWRARA